jgi:hypothetical protein
MADSKEKPKSGGEEGGGGSNFFVDAIFWILLSMVAYATIKGAFSNLDISFDFIPSAEEVSSTIFNTVQVFSIFISLLFLIGIIYFNFKLGELSKHGHGHGHGGHDNSHDGHAEVTKSFPEQKVHKDSFNHTSDKRWSSVLERLASTSEGDWRLSIIESDILLDDMLGRIGYVGDTMADKLKQVKKVDFNTIDLAWEAHKVRNRIAHDGGAFHMTKQEAERVIGLYKKVFDEFYFI